MAAQHERMLEEIAEQHGRRQHDGDAAQCTARGDRQIELGQAAGCRLQFHHLAVADHAAGEQRRRLQHELRGTAGATDSGTGRNRLVPASSRNSAPNSGPAVDAGIAEDDHECEQIEAERHHPQERHHRRPLRDGVGGRQQQDGAERGEADP